MASPALNNRVRITWTRLRIIIYDSQTIPAAFGFGAFMAAPVGLLAVVGPNNIGPDNTLAVFVTGLAIYLCAATIFVLALGVFVCVAPSKILHHQNREQFLQASREDWRSHDGDELSSSELDEAQWINLRRASWNLANEKWSLARLSLFSLVIVSIFLLLSSGIAFAVALVEFLLLSSQSEVSPNNIQPLGPTYP